VVHKVSTISTTCFGIYIGHCQVVFNLSSNYTRVCVVYSRGWAELSFKIVGSMKFTLLIGLLLSYINILFLTVQEQIMFINKGTLH